MNTDDKRVAAVLKAFLPLKKVMDTFGFHATKKQIQSVLKRPKKQKKSQRKN